MSDLPDSFDTEGQSTGKQDRAYHNSGVVEFKGNNLFPFSFIRQAAALELGMKYFRLSPDDLFQLPNPVPLNLRKEGDPDVIDMYSGLLMDTAIVLWLCSQTDSVVSRARRKPLEYDAQIAAFATANGIEMGSPDLSDATYAFMEIINQVISSRGEPVSNTPSSGSSNPPAPPN